MILRGHTTPTVKSLRAAEVGRGPDLSGILLLEKKNAGAKHGAEFGADLAFGLVVSPNNKYFSASCYRDEYDAKGRFTKRVNAVGLYDFETASKIAKFEFEHDQRVLGFSPDSKTMFVGNLRRHVRSIKPNGPTKMELSLPMTCGCCPVLLTPTSWNT